MVTKWDSSLQNMDTRHYAAKLRVNISIKICFAKGFVFALWPIISVGKQERPMTLAFIFIQKMDVLTDDDDDDRFECI